MAHIVELREMSDDQLEELLEDRREEMFNLRFQKASARLQDTTRLRAVRREIAQMKEVLHKRRLAVEAAARQPEIAAALEGQRWDAFARYIYEDVAWSVEFYDRDGSEIATALVNLNEKRRRDREPELVTSYEVAA